MLNQKSQFYESFPFFNWIYYINSYPDLKHLKTERQAINHFIKYGFKEKRRYTGTDIKLKNTIIHFFSFESLQNSWARYWIDRENSVCELLSRTYDAQIENHRIETYFDPDLSIPNQKEGLYVFSELSYAHFLNAYDKRVYLRKKITSFLSSIKYISLFCEIIQNDDLQTVGNAVKNFYFSMTFFERAYRVYVCDTKNQEYLHPFTSNIVYFPIYVLRDETKDIDIKVSSSIDILCYDNTTSEFFHRSHLHNFLMEFARKNEYTCEIKSNLYDYQKEILLHATKVVVHCPSHPNLRTFPWAKTLELMKKGIFFIIEQNNEMYIQGLDKIVVYYEDLDDLSRKLIYFLENDSERKRVIDMCFRYAIRWSSSRFLSTL